jgi:hypothetical protein
METPVYFVFNGLNNKQFAYSFISDGKKTLSVIRVNLYNLEIFFFVLRLSKFERNIVYNCFTLYLKVRLNKKRHFNGTALFKIFFAMDSITALDKMTAPIIIIVICGRQTATDTGFYP